MNGLEGRIAVVVPTYWTRPGGAVRPGDAVYDHPTPLDEAGTLGRLLESLRALDADSFYVVIIVGVTELALSAAASSHVRSICAEFSSLSILIVDGELLLSVQQALSLGQETPLVGLQDYSRVRNLQLLVPLVLDASAIVAVDDDEVVRDPRFLDRALDCLGSPVDGHVVAGSSGYYLQDLEGDVLLAVPAVAESAPNIFSRKAEIMNEGTMRLESMPGEVVPTPFCFGGNMVFTPHLASTVCFDPAITRGEDIDYLINARLAGQWFFMNKRLTILHLPPTGGSYKDVAFHKVVQDVLRFMYEREKIRAWREIGAAEAVTTQELDPYPGRFLRDDLEVHAEEVIQQVLDQTDAEQRAWLGLGDSAVAFLEDAREKARKGVDGYRSHQDEWARVAAQARTNAQLRTLLEEAIAGGQGEALSEAF